MAEREGVENGGLKKTAEVCLCVCMHMYVHVVTLKKHVRRDITNSVTCLWLIKTPPKAVVIMNVFIANGGLWLRTS